MPQWGVNKNRADIPKNLLPHLKDAVILTEKGWQIRASGTDNVNARQVLVAFDGTGATTANNDGPTVFVGFDNTTDTFPALTGVSGAAINTYYIQVYDLEQKASDGGLIFATSGDALPEGLSITTSADFDYAFLITGTPGASGAGTLGISFSDGASNASAYIPFDISE